MALSAKHFRHIADIIAEYDPNIRANLAHSFADFCAEHNPNFKPALFYEACGVDFDNEAEWRVFSPGVVSK